MVQASIILSNTKAASAAANSAQTILNNTKSILAQVKENLKGTLKK